MRNQTISTLILGFLGFVLMSVFAAPVVHAQVVSVPQIEVARVGSYNGKYLTVYYGIGSRATIATADDQISLREVKYKKTVRIEGNSVVLPKVDLSRSGIFLAYNIVVMVIHSDNQFTWKNINGSLPEGETNGDSSIALAIDSLTKPEIDGLRTNADSLRFEFGTKITQVPVR
jgi:hypothetical protein